ncbi:hypothetical protein B0H13DRAFT_2319637 [Mycena leptocephala]|nr:hypothetical protein B0H13DRAFT_2319637 [Mycena leptocephala]
MSPWYLTTFDATPTNDGHCFCLYSRHGAWSPPFASASRSALISSSKVFFFLSVSLRDVWQSMRARPLLALICSAASLGRALIITIPETTATQGSPFTITYQNEAADPAGNMTFWLGHVDGAGGYFDLSQAVPPAKTATKFAVDLNFRTGDGEQWVVAGGPVSNFPEGFFGVSKPFTIIPPSSSSSAPISSTVSSASHTSTGPPSTSSNPGTSAPANSSPSASPSGSSSVSKSAPSVGLIVGVTFGVTALLVLILVLAFLYLRKMRRRRRGMDLEVRSIIEPAFTPHSALAASHGAYGSANDRAAHQIEAFLPASSEYLMNQMRAVQWQLQSLQGVTGTASSATSDFLSGSESDSLGLQQAKQQNEALQERIRALEEQLNSQWALGLSDEPPPGCLARTRRHLNQQDRVDVVSTASSPHLLLDNTAREPHIYALAAPRCPTATPFHTHPLDTTSTRTIPRRALPRSHSTPPTSFLSPTAQCYPARSLRARIPRICAARHQSHAHRFARGFIVLGTASIVPPSPLDACASAHSTTSPTSNGVCSASPFAHGAFSASSRTRILLSHPPSMPARYTPRYDDTRLLQRPRPPFLVSHPTAVARAEPVHARSNMPRTSAPLAAPCSSAPFRECASARGREGVLRDPSNGDIFTSLVRS